MENIDLLLKGYPERLVRRNEPMSDHTTFRIGGPADVALFPDSEEALVQALRLFPDAVVIGGGSNVLVSDAGIRGAVILLSRSFSGVTVSGERLVCLAGTPLPRVAAEALKNGLSGFEFASGIPGSIGGATAMNAGAYGGEMSQVLESCRLFEDDEIKCVSCADMAYGYRASRVLSRGGIVLSSSIRLAPGDKEEIARSMSELAARRRDKQPLSYPSAGSFFKRPTGYFAGKLIEDAGLKGARVGDAMVSEKHAGFIINCGHATASDVRRLMDHVIKTVRDASGVTLENEVRLLGEF